MVAVGQVSSPSVYVVVNAYSAATAAATATLLPSLLSSSFGKYEGIFHLGFKLEEKKTVSNCITAAAAATNYRIYEVSIY